MQAAVFVGAGGFVGSLARYFVSLAFAAFGLTQFPFGTALVNFVGSFLIGAALSLGQQKLGTNTYALLVPGLLGGFTTYSAFAGESLLFLQQGRYLAAGAYILGTVAGCLLACWLGFSLASR